MNPVTGRRVTTGVTMTALFLVLCGMAFWGWQHLTAPVEGAAASSSQSCSPSEITTTRFVRPADVQVSVFNAGDNSGMAGRTMNRLEQRGFRPGQVGNAPAGMHVKRVVVHTTHKNDPAAELVSRQLGKHTRVVVTARRGGPGIDVFIGNKFHKLRKHAVGKVRLPKPQHDCVRVQ